MSSSSTADAIIMSRDVDLSKITFSAPKQNTSNAGRTIFVNYGGGDLYLQTPCMTAPFGISMWPGDRGAPDKYTLDLSFAGRESNPGIQEFHDMLQGLTALVLDTAFENANTWLKKRIPSQELISQIFTKMIRYSKDKITGEESTMYPPSFKLNLPMKDGAFTFKSYDMNRQLLDLSAMLAESPRPCKGARVTAIIQLSSIWVVGQSQFGVTWKVCTLRIQMPPSLQTYAFLPDENDAAADADADADADDVDSDGVKAIKSATGKSATAKYASGSDGDDALASGALAENEQLFM